MYSVFVHIHCYGAGDNIPESNAVSYGAGDNIPASNALRFLHAVSTTKLQFDKSSGFFYISVILTEFESSIAYLDHTSLFPLYLHSYHDVVQIYLHAC